MKNIIEEQDTPQITSSEIRQWEDLFRKEVSPEVKFDIQQGQQGSMVLYNGQSGVEATWKGTIMFGSDNYIKWTFTLQNEPFVETKMTLTEDHYNVFVKLYNFYAKWKKEWSEEMTVPDSGTPEETPHNPDNGLPTSMPSDMGASMPPGSPAPLGERKSLRNKETILANNNERMRRLAGVWKKK